MENFRFLFLIKLAVPIGIVFLILVLFKFALHFTNLARTIIRRIIILLSFFLSTIYLAWRIFYTAPPEGGLYTVLFIFLLSAEFLDCFNSFVLKATSWKSYKLPLTVSKKFPSIDVLIMTYKEDMAILERTILACTNLRYPREMLNIYVCDDGARVEVKELSQRFGVNYISREVPLNAKAGNINNALGKTNGELVFILDADMIVRSDFLEKTVGYFEDSKVGFVQLPQVFYNHDPFQYNLHLYDSIHNEQDLFMRHIQPDRANYNAVIHVGTNAVFRRKVLEEIGGVPCFSITEDISTGILIQAAGYKGIYVNEVLAVGLAPESFSAFVRQRIRWCRGAIQTFKHLKPLFIKGLNFKQRILYLDSFLYWLFGIKKLIYITFPLLYVYFGFQSFFAHFEDVILFFIPHFMAGLFSFKLVTNNSRSFLMSHIYETSVTPVIAWSFIAEAFFKKLSVFHVTPKGSRNKRARFNFILALPGIIFLLLTLLAFYNMYQHIRLDLVESYEAYWINGIWMGFNMIGLISSIFVCMDRKRKRNEERFYISIPAVIIAGEKEKMNCLIKDFSNAGLKLEMNFRKGLKALKEVFILINNNIKIKCGIIWVKKRGSKVLFGVKVLEKGKSVDLFSMFIDGLHVYTEKALP